MSQSAEAMINVHRDPESEQEVRKIAFVGPIVTLLIAGLTQLVNFDIGIWGLWLLVGYAALGFVLGAMPRRARLWDAPPATSWARVKQSVGTLRTIVSIVLVLFPIAILATNKPWLATLPQGFDRYVKTMTDRQHPPVQVLYLPSVPKSAKFIYVGRLDRGPEAATVALTPAASQTGATGKLYIIETDQVISGIARDWILPGFYSIATAALVISGLFVFAVYLMELLGDAFFASPSLHRAKP